MKNKKNVKVIKLTESDLQRIVRKVIMEDNNSSDSNKSNQTKK